MPQDILFIGRFHWKDLTPDVERDIAIARDAPPFRKDSSFALEGMHPWLAYSRELLGFVDDYSSRWRRGVIRIEAESAESRTPEWTVVEDPDTSSGRRLELSSMPTRRPPPRCPSPRSPNRRRAHGLADAQRPVRGRSAGRRPVRAVGAMPLVVAAGSWASSWTRATSPSRRRAAAPRAATLDAPPGTWIEQPWRTRLDLGAGRHSIRLYSRVPGLAVDRITLRHAGSAA